jgi:outer membrane murein-binding lipoprotein Lpp
MSETALTTKLGTKAEEAVRELAEKADALAEEMDVLRRSLEDAQIEAAETSGENERLEDQIGRGEALAGKLTEHLHVFQGHHGAVSLCPARICTEAIDYLRMEAGVVVR